MSNFKSFRHIKSLILQCVNDDMEGVRIVNLALASLCFQGGILGLGNRVQHTGIFQIDVKGNRVTRGLARQIESRVPTTRTY
jgi:hypothetical protein